VRIIAHTHERRTHRFAVGACAVAIAASCGGSVENADTSQSVGGVGGLATGGSSGQAGASGQAGTSGQAGAGGAPEDAGSAPDCFAEPRSRLCAEGGGFYFDRASGTCRSYDFNQCSESRNGFSSLAACLEICPGARPDLSACDTTLDCVAADAGCCDACEPVGPDALLAINVKRARAGDFRDPCPGTVCLPCPPVDELDRTQQYFVPWCQNGTCRVSDVRDGYYSACDSHADCVLRDGAACCEGCDGQGLAAVNMRHQPASICDGNLGCPECAPIIPPEFGARCQNGVCRVIRAVDAGTR